MADFDPPAKKRRGQRSGRRKGQKPPSSKAAAPDKARTAGASGPSNHAGAGNGLPLPRGGAENGNDSAARPNAPLADAARAQGWTKPLPHHRQAYAAIDLGTNNCRLLIARPSGDHFVVIDAFSRVVRLGEGLAQSGRLSDAAMDRALAALHVCAEKLKKRNVHLARSVATAPCPVIRRCNCGDARNAGWRVPTPP